MDDIQRNYNKLHSLLQDRNFLEGNGLSNEVNIRVFHYDPEDEMIARYFVDRLLADKEIGSRLIVFNLYELFLEICEDFHIVERVAAMEEKYGNAHTLEKLQTMINSKKYVKKMSEKAGPKKGNVILLTGVGDVFPFMRVHKLLDAIQPQFPNVPIVVMYPGSYDGTALKLFDILEPSPYYRAFNVL